MEARPVITQQLKHNHDCKNPSIPYYQDSCGDFCEYRQQAVKECVEAGQHFRGVISQGGYDVCFNCGGKS